MSKWDSTSLLPPRTKTQDGNERRVGVEIELAGVGGLELAQCVADSFNGSVSHQNRYEYVVEGSSFGDFKLELDSDYLKRFERASVERKAGSDDEWVVELENISSDLLTLAAEQFVPWEIVAPPIAISELGYFDQLLQQLRERGARGTRYAARFAFGVHLNPELPALDAATILKYLRAYFCLYDWIADREKIDVSRLVTPYIKHFKRDYIASVIDLDYTPDQDTLIDDYLQANPTRNRSLDLLPLFAHLDGDRVRKVVDDPRIKSRPTFHYRLPNCDIDNLNWDLRFPWGNWLQVERLAENQQQLAEACTAYQQDLTRLAGLIDNDWLQKSRQWVDLPEPESV
nr:putative amidoligase family protein [uncultured bacterium]